MQYINALSGAAITRIISFVTAIIIARELGVEEFGLFSFFFVVMNLVKYALSVLDINYYREVDTRDPNSLIGVLIISKLIIALAGLSVPLVIMVLYKAGFWESRFIVSLFTGIVAGLMFSIITSLSTYFRERSRFFISALSGSLFTYMVFVVILFYVFVFEALTLQIAFGVYLMSIFFVVIFVFSYFAKPLKALYLEKRLSWKQTMTFLSSSRNFWGAHIMTVIGSRVDMLMIPYIVSPAEVGLYGAAIRISQIVQFLIDSITTIFLPKGLRKNAGDIKLGTYVKNILFTIILLSPVLGVLFYGAEYLLNVLFGDQFTRVAIVVQLLIVVEIIRAFYVPLSYIVYGFGKPMMLMAIEFIKILSVLVVFLASYQYFGIASVPLSLLVAFVLSVILVLTIIIKTGREKRH